MKYLQLLFVLLLILIPVAVNAQNGVILENLSMESNILGERVEYSVYLPAGYETSRRSYPVMYLLHGFSDDETAWTQFGEVKTIADAQMAKVEVTPMIIVMPDAGVSWYINSLDDSLRYEDFFMEEFMPRVEEEYRIRSEKQFRAVAGLSMGGYGAMIYALKHPDLFAAAAPLSAGIINDQDIVDMDMDRWNEVFGIPFGKGLEGKERLTAHYRNHSVLDLVETVDNEKLKSVRYYIDCGDDDFLIKGNMALHSHLLDREVPHEFRVRDGSHRWDYWRSALPEVLQFFSTSFHR